MTNQVSQANTWHEKEIEVRWMLTKGIWHEDLIRRARLKRPVWRNVADFGCGWMGLLERAWKKEWSAGTEPVLGVGVDPDRKSIAKCQERLREQRLPILYMVGDMDDLARFQGVEFDVVFCWEVFYLLDDAQLDRTIGAIRSVLSKDGILLCGTLSHRSVPDPVMDAFYPDIAKNIVPCTPHWRLESEYVRMLQKHGFSVEVDRIFVSPEEYAEKFVPLPPEMFWFPDDAHRRAYYTEYGKSVWTCRIDKPGTSGAAKSP